MRFTTCWPSYHAILVLLVVLLFYCTQIFSTVYPFNSMQFMFSRGNLENESHRPTEQQMYKAKLREQLISV